MNRILRNSLNSFAKNFGLFSSNLASTIVSLLRICVLSKVGAAIKSRKYSQLKLHDNCVVLANGPSLKSAIEEGIDCLEESDVFCVNLFFKSDAFWIIKPRFYFVVDEQFFDPTYDRTKEQVREMREALTKIDWEMYLVTSPTVVNAGILSNLNNNNIKVIRMNSTAADGFSWFKKLVYNLNLGMPRCQTVTNFAIMAAVNLHYSNVYLYGADHSWTRDLMVDDNNVTCYGDRHVYNTQLSVIKLDYSISELLHDFANMFESHKTINEFALYKGVNIINCTKGSFIDAYKRKVENL
ncbi:MAG: DUF115 domain-containing protein [Bacteroidales bacterium]|nr:DUF115 domain-containing protein [Bacteroidales bacterium]